VSPFSLLDEPFIAQLAPLALDHASSRRDERSTFSQCELFNGTLAGVHKARQG
jgi:hypothetical protein